MTATTGGSEERSGDKLNSGGNEMDAKKEYMRDYMREYRRKNRDKVNAQRREWAKNNPEKIKEYDERYWTKKSEEGQKE